MDNSSSGMIELSQVTTSRGQFPVLSRFTLTISQGQFINLYGPTGCGKTTVLRLICGLADPASGTVRVAGQDLSTLSSGARKRLRRSFGLFTRTARHSLRSFHPGRHDAGSRRADGLRSFPACR